MYQNVHNHPIDNYILYYALHFCDKIYPLLESKEELINIGQTKFRTLNNVLKPQAHF